MSATLKVTISRLSFASRLQVIVPPGFDVDAYVHTEGEEISYVIEGQLDVLAFEPIDRSVKDWHEWVERPDETRPRRAYEGSAISAGGVRLAVPVGEENRMRGSWDASVTLVEYGDYDSPFTVKAHEAAQDLREGGRP